MNHLSQFLLVGHPTMVHSVESSDWRQQIQNLRTNGRVGVFGCMSKTAYFSKDKGDNRSERSICFEHEGDDRRSQMSAESGS